MAAPLRRWRWSRFAVLLLLALGATYWYLTRPERLRALLTAALPQDLELLALEEISFTPWGGLHVGRISLRQRQWPCDNRPSSRADIESARVQGALVGLLGGRFHPRRVVLEGVRLLVVRPEDAVLDGAWPRSSGPDGVLGGFDSLPELVVSSADVQLYKPDADGRVRLLRRWVVRASGGPERDAGESGTARYVLRVHQIGGTAAVPRELQHGPLLEFSAWRGAQCARLGWVDLDLVAALGPRPLQQLLHEWGVSGQVRGSEWLVDAEGVRTAELRLVGGQLALPVEAESLRSNERFLQLDQVNAHLRFDRVATHGPAGTAVLHADGRARGAPFRLRATARTRDARGSHEPAWSSALLADLLDEFEIDLVADGLDFPHPGEHAAFLASPHLPGPVRSFLQDYRPSGRCRLAISAQRPAGSAEARLTGALEPRGASCRYFRFPYTIEDVYGRVRFGDGSVYLEGLHGRHGTARLSADGRLADTSEWTAFDLEVRGADLPLDGDLYAALSSEQQQLWRHAEPTGQADVMVTIRRPPGDERRGPAQPVIVIDAQLSHGAVSLGPGRRLEQAQGRVRIRDDRLTLDELGGSLDGATLVLDGDVHSDQGGVHHQVQFRAANLAFERAHEVRDASGDLLGRLRLTGRGDVVGACRSASPDAPAQERYDVTLHDGTLTAFDSRQAWRPVTGRIQLHDNGGMDLSISAGRAAGRLDIHAQLAGGSASSLPIALSVRGEDAELDTLLRAWAPSRWAALLDSLALRGAGRVTAVLERPASAVHADGTPADARLALELRADRMHPRALPLLFRNVHGRVLFDPTGFEIAHAGATFDEAAFTLRGEGQWAVEQPTLERAPDVWPAGEQRYWVEARGLTISPAVLHGLPPKTADLLRSLALKGQADVTLDPLVLDGDGCRIGGRLALRGASMRLGLLLSEFEGALRGSLRFDAGGGVAANTEFEVARGTLGGRPIERLQGNLRAEGDGAIHLRDVRAQFCDGQLMGSVRVEPQTGEYEVSVVLTDLDLQALLGAAAGDRPTAATSGRVDGHVFVRGRGPQAEQRFGGGTLRIRGGSLLATPVSASLLPSILTGRSTERVEEAVMRFAWQGDDVRLEQVDIVTSERRLTGAGRWNLRNDAVDISLVETPAGPLGQLGPFSDLLQAAGREIVQYRVTGTAANPRTIAEPLSRLSDVVRRVLPE